MLSGARFQIPDCAVQKQNKLRFFLRGKTGDDPCFTVIDGFAHGFIAGGTLWKNVNPLAPPVGLVRAEFNEARQYRVIAAYDEHLQPQAVPAAGETILRYYNAYWLDPGESLWQDRPLTVGFAGGEHTLTLPAAYTPYDTMQTESGIILQLVNDADESYSSAFYNSKGSLRIDAGRYSWISERADLVTGETVLLGQYPGGVGYDIYDSTGKLLLSLPDTEWYPQLCSGLVLVQNLYGTGLRTLSGDWVFRYLVPDTDM